MDVAEDTGETPDSHRTQGSNSESPDSSFESSHAGTQAKTRRAGERRVSAGSPESQEDVHPPRSGPCPKRKRRRMVPPVARDRNRKRARRLSVSSCSSSDTVRSSSGEWQTDQVVGAVAKRPRDAMPQGGEQWVTPVPHRHRKEIAPPKYSDPAKSFSEYLAGFVEIAEYNRWDDKAKTVQLRNCIVANAGARIVHVPRGIGWTELNKELQSIFCSKRALDACRVRWANVKRDPGEDLEMYAVRLLELSRRANPDAPDKEQERFAREKFVDTAGSSETEFWLRVTEPKSLQDAVDAAIRYESANRRDRPRKPDMGLPVSAAVQGGELPAAAPARGGAEGKPSSPNLDEKIARAVERALDKNYRRGEAPRRHRRPEAEGGKAAIRCFRCNGRGHLSRHCDDRKFFSPKARRYGKSPKVKAHQSRPQKKRTESLNA